MLLLFLDENSLLVFGYEVSILSFHWGISFPAAGVKPSSSVYMPQPAGVYIGSRLVAMATTCTHVMVSSSGFNSSM